MKIDQKKFDELSQLDRIEFRQKIEGIEKRFTTNFTTTFVWVIFFLGTSFMVAMLCEAVFLGTQNLRNSISTLGIYAIFIIVMGVFLDLLTLKYKDKKINELEQEYFEVKTRRKK